MRIFVGGCGCPISQDAHRGLGIKDGTMVIIFNGQIVFQRIGIRGDNTPKPITQETVMGSCVTDLQRPIWGSLFAKLTKEAVRPRIASSLRRLLGKKTESTLARTRFLTLEPLNYGEALFMGFSQPVQL